MLRRHFPALSYVRLDGNTRSRDRFRISQQFNADPTIHAMLATTRAGGLGINLTSADTVIFIEHNWNPQVDLQAMDRSHRIGQRNVLHVYRLYMVDSIEERILHIQRDKLDLVRSVITDENSAAMRLGTDGVVDRMRAHPAASQTTGGLDEGMGMGNEVEEVSNAPNRTTRAPIGPNGEGSAHSDDEVEAQYALYDVRSFVSMVVD